MANIPILDGCTLFGPWPQHAADLSVESLLATMAHNGIVRSMATATTGIFYDYRQGNAETLVSPSSIRNSCFPSRRSIRALIPNACRKPKRVLPRAFACSAFFRNARAGRCAFAPFRDLLQKCDELGVLVAVTTAHAGDITAIADEVAFTRAPLLLAGVTSRHLGEALSVMKNDPKFYMETTGLLAPGALESVCECIDKGAERLIFASYSPLRYLSTALAPVLSAALSDEDKTLILGGNLKRLLTKQ
jgi:hypothetical protein